MRVAPQSSQASTWPPSAAVRQASQDGAHDASLDAAEVFGMCAAIGVAVVAEDIRRFQIHRHGAAGSGGRYDLQCQPIERAFRPSDEPVRDPRVTRRARQIGVPQQDLNNADIRTALQEMRGEAVPQRVHRDPLGQAGRGTSGSAGRVQHLDIERLTLVPAGKQPMLRTRQTPIGPQNAEPLGRQHDRAVLAALALLDPDNHPATVNIGDLEAHRLAGAQSRCVGGRQRSTRLQARRRLEKSYDLVGVQHHGQLMRLSSIGDPFWDRIEAQRDPIEEPQGADRLVQRRP
jgi:hypothetical protein